jgi:secretion/DNA translocation related TadE-like protein
VSRETGAGTALAVALVAAIVVLFGLLASVAVVLDAHRRAVSTADAAALAAADTALGNATGVPCARAAGIVAAASLRLDGCAQRGALVRVRVSASVLGLALDAVAVAGPPPAR